MKVYYSLSVNGSWAGWGGVAAVGVDLLARTGGLAWCGLCGLIKSRVQFRFEYLWKVSKWVLSLRIAPGLRSTYAAIYEAVYMDDDAVGWWWRKVGAVIVPPDAEIVTAAEGDDDGWMPLLLGADYNSRN